MFGTPYFGYNQQTSADRIDRQIAELQKMKEQLPPNVMPTPGNQPAINQTFQLAPSGSSGIKYANSIDDVMKELVIMDTPFFSKDMSVLWIKNTKNEIRTYTLTEIIQKDEKDMLIESLQYQIEELKKGQIENAKSIDEYVDEPIKSKEPTDIPDVRTSKKKSK